MKFIEKAINSMIKMRKITQLVIEQKKGKHCPRPNINILMISSFGTAKSTRGDQLSEILKDDVLLTDDFSKPSLIGTINKDKEFIGGIMSKVGGKILVIDEFNSLSQSAKDILLPVIENQKIHRELGFKVAKSENIKNEFTNIAVKEGNISGKVTFSCFANAMYFPADHQKAYALLSRFTPVYLIPTKQMIKQITRGEFTLDIRNFKSKTRIIIIKNTTQEQINDIYWESIERQKIDPPSQKKGFLTRLYNDIIRFSVAEQLKENDKKEVIFNDIDSFSRNCDELIPIIWNNYFAQIGNTNKVKFLRYYQNNPSLRNDEYANMFNVSEKTIRNWIRGK